MSGSKRTFYLFRILVRICYFLGVIPLTLADYSKSSRFRLVKGRFQWHSFVAKFLSFTYLLFILRIFIPWPPESKYPSGQVYLSSTFLLFIFAYLSLLFFYYFSDVGPLLNNLVNFLDAYEEKNYLAGDTDREYHRHWKLCEYLILLFLAGTVAPVIFSTQALIMPHHIYLFPSILPKGHLYDFFVLLNWLFIAYQGTIYWFAGGFTICSMFIYIRTTDYVLSKTRLPSALKTRPKKPSDGNMEVIKEICVMYRAVAILNIRSNHTTSFVHNLFSFWIGKFCPYVFYVVIRHHGQLGHFMTILFSLVGCFKIGVWFLYLLIGAKFEKMCFKTIVSWVPRDGSIKTYANYPGNTKYEVTHMLKKFQKSCHCCTVHNIGTMDSIFFILSSCYTTPSKNAYDILKTTHRVGPAEDEGKLFSPNYKKRDIIGTLLKSN